MDDPSLRRRSDMSGRRWQPAFELRSAVVSFMTRDGSR